MFSSPTFWYTVAFLIFIGLAFRFVRKPMLGWLDGEIAKIREELARAKQLRQEAEATLAEYKNKYAEAVAEAEEIVRYAQEEAIELRDQAEADLKAALARHEQQATDRIRMAEAEALGVVRSAAVEMAMVMTRSSLAKQAGKIDQLTDQAIAELPKMASAKAKAA